MTRIDVDAMDIELSDLRPWRPVVTQARERVLQYRIAGTGPFAKYISRDAEWYATKAADVEVVITLCLEAVRSGRLIDFGDWPQAVIKHGGNRGGPLYTRGALAHPFADPWLLFHTWEETACLYLVQPLDDGRGTAGCDCEAVELNPIFVKNEPFFLIGDRMLLEPSRDGPAEEWKRYTCQAIPSVWRYLPGAEAANNHMAPEAAAAGNVLDPLMTALLVLSTRGIERHTVAASDKLQKARAKRGKPPIPSYDVVESRPYVTAIQLRGASQRGPSQGGTHASPVPHLRIGHERTLASGKKTFVRDTLVAMTPDAKAAWQANRSHYAIKH